ncbi:MAG: WG repeat-containing protein, partial [Candidatus Aegiribacteria sp.]|nr:WG repeat-containing protein [Candidatus Aegiribacteria sp.]
AGDGQARWLKRVAGKVGFMAPDGRWLIEPVFEDAGVLSHDRVAFRHEWLWGYLDTHGTEVVSPRFHSAADFQEGLARVQSNKNHLYGFIAVDGSWVIEPVFTKAEHMFDGLTLVENEQFQEYVDSQGRRAIKIDFAHAHSFASGMALVCNDMSGPFGFIDKSGGVVIPLDLEAAWHFCQGYAPAMKNGKWGHLDQAGGWAVQPVYQRVDYLFNGFARVMKDDHWGVVDTQGKVIVSPRFNTIEISGEFFKVKEGKMHGLLNRNGEQVVEPRYTGMGGVAENLIPVKEAEDTLWGYIDVHGQWAIEPRYAAAHDFGNGHALIKAADSQPGIINTDGMITATLNVELNEAGPFAASGVAWICLGGKYGLVRVDGRILLDPELEEVNGTGSDWIRVKYPSR